MLALLGSTTYITSLNILEKVVATLDRRGKDGGGATGQR